MLFRLGDLLAVDGCPVVPSAECYPSAAVDVCIWNCWDVPDFGHGVDHPILALMEGLDFFLDHRGSLWLEISLVAGVRGLEMPAGPACGGLLGCIVWRRTPGGRSVLERVSHPCHELSPRNSACVLQEAWAKITGRAMATQR